MTNLHMFDPDHNLLCLRCSEGEISGDHGIHGIVDGSRVYASSEARAMYEKSEAPEERGSKPITVARLIDYLQQLSPEFIVVLTESDVQEPCEFVALDGILREMEASSGD